MHISVNSHGDILEINVNGRLDATSSPVVHDTLTQHIDSGFRMIIMNFSNLDYISSSGLRVLLMALKSIQKENGRMHFYGVKEHVREVFDLAGFSPFFRMYTTRQEAIDTLKEK